MAMQPQEVDIYVGRRIRMKRIELEMSQETLGDKAGITFQQIQKYEKGTNRVGASRLQRIAEALGVAPAWFFEGGPGSPNISPTATLASDFFGTGHHAVHLARAYMALSGKKRGALLAVAKALVAESEEEPPPEGPDEGNDGDHSGQNRAGNNNGNGQAANRERAAHSAGRPTSNLVPFFDQKHVSRREFRSAAKLKVVGR